MTGIFRKGLRTIFRMNDRLERGWSARSFHQGAQQVAARNRDALARLQQTVADFAQEINQYNALLDRYIRKYEAGDTTTETLEKYFILRLEKYARDIDRLKRAIIKQTREF